MTVACLNTVGNLPSEKDRLAKCAIITENTVVHRITKEVGIMSIVEVLAGDDLRTHSVTHSLPRLTNEGRSNPDLQIHQYRWISQCPLLVAGIMFYLDNPVGASKFQSTAGGVPVTTSVLQKYLYIWKAHTYNKNI